MNEQELRKPEWVEGVWITLGDDQSWCLPKPVVFQRATRFRRKIVTGPDGASSLGMPIPIDADPYFAKMAELFLLEDVDYLNALLNLAAILLRHNYDLDDDALGDLLIFEHDEDGQQTDANREMWLAIRDVAIGNAPKPTPVG